MPKLENLEPERTSYRCFPCFQLNLANNPIEDTGMRSILGGLLRLLGLRRFVLDVTDCKLTQTSVGMFERSVLLNPDTLRELDLTMASNDFSAANNMRDVANLALITSLESIRIDLSDTNTVSLRRDECLRH